MSGRYGILEIEVVHNRIFFPIYILSTLVLVRVRVRASPSFAHVLLQQQTPLCLQHVHYYNIQFFACPLHIASALPDGIRAGLITIQGPLGRNETCIC